MTSNVLELVSLGLYDLGPTTLNDLCFHTGIAALTLRTHLHTHCGTRYTYDTDLSQGFPIRRWRLMTAQEIADNEQ